MVKQIIVVRKDLNMRKGKMVAQGCHASMKVFVDRGLMNSNSISIPLDGDMIEWLSGSFTKICVSVDSESELDSLFVNAQLAGLPCTMIVDSGRTEFNGIPTKTCIAIGPASAERIDPVTSHLPLL